MANEVRIDVKVNNQQSISAVNALNKSWVGLNAALSLGQQAARTLGDVYDFLIADTQAYAQSTLQMMRITGQSAEVTSRMIQLTDDFGVSQEALTMAMRGAATKGIAFTTENLAKLSDEYLKLAPGVERTTFLVDQFGTRGAEMAKVLDKGSQAIIDQSAAIADNLVLTQEAIDASEEWRIAQDDLNDSITGMKNTLGTEALPILAFYARTISNSAQYQDDFNKKFGFAADALRVLFPLYAIGAERISQANAKEREFASTLAEANAQLNLVATYGPGAAAAMQGIADTAPTAEGAVAGLNDKMNGLRGAADGIAQAYNDMNTAQANLEAATQSFGEKVGGDLQSALEGAGVKGDRLHQALTIIDEVMGTSLDPAQKLQDITSQLASDYATGKITADEFRQKLVDQKTAMENLYQPIVNARVALEDMEATLKRLTSQIWRVQIETGYIPTPDGGSGGGGGTPQDPYGDTSPYYNPYGGNNITADMIGDISTGERIGGGSSNITNNQNWGGITVILPNVTNAGQFVSELGKLANNARNSGRGTQGA